MTLKQIVNGATLGASGVIAAGLIIYYLGDLPVIKQANKGLQGVVAGWGR